MICFLNCILVQLSPEGHGHVHIFCWVLGSLHLFSVLDLWPFLLDSLPMNNYGISRDNKGCFWRLGCLTLECLLKLEGLGIGLKHYRWKHCVVLGTNTEGQILNRILVSNKRMEAQTTSGPETRETALFLVVTDAELFFSYLWTSAQNCNQSQQMSTKPHQVMLVSEITLSKVVSNIISKCIFPAGLLIVGNANKSILSMTSSFSLALFLPPLSLTHTLSF